MDQGDRDRELERLTAAARELDATGRAAAAEAAWEAVFRTQPTQPDAAVRLGRLAMQRRDAARALHFLRGAAAAYPEHASLATDLAFAHLALGQPQQAMAALETAVAAVPGHVEAWLLLGEIRDNEGDSLGALKAWFQAVTRAQRSGRWHGQDTTPAHLLEAVIHAITTVRDGRRTLLFSSFDEVRAQVGASELRRVERALTGYLGDWDATPPHPSQRPNFLYFPDLPETPYMSPELHPWSSRLRDAFPVIRDDALRTLAEDESTFRDFVQLKDKSRMTDFVGGTGPAPAWEALFFYRRGKRHDDNHLRCPGTSAVLESIDLCRIADQTPEICFSRLKPGSHILRHFGVSNTRAVMHLPLVVPPDCALNLVGVGEHHWREGELVLFDDTYDHEAWNRSDRDRVILLMDCWNPHLTQAERLAVTKLVETIGALSAADEARPADAGT